MIVIWIIVLLFTVFTLDGKGAEPEQDTQQELTVGDKAKIAAGVCLFGLFWSDTKPEETEYIYSTDDNGAVNPIPIGVIRKEKKP